jgi:hypothetical protein
METENMKKNLFICAASALLAMLFTLSCSGGDDDGGSQAGNPSSSSGGIDSGASITKAKITGVFQKGPFVKGTMATLNELNNNLSPTGRPYQTLITDDKGTFELKDVELVSPYAHLIATGYFQNEVTGKKSNGTITLQAIVDVTDKDNINVNVITHLEYYRVLDLVGGGMTVKAAKKQAQREIFAVFGIDSDGFKDSEDMTIFGASESDAALLAVSVLLLGNLGEADFTERIMDFSQRIRNGGSWDNEREKDKMADWAARADLEDIRQNIVGWGLVSDVPPFEKYLYDYWVAGYELGVCNAEEQYNIKNDCVCKDDVWQRANNKDRYCFENGCSRFTDTRDGITYRITTIGDFTFIVDWPMFRGEDGDIGVEYESLRFDYDLVYTWDEAQNVCPSGWRIPNDTEILCPIFNESCLLKHLFELNISNFWVNGANDSQQERNPVFCVKD